MTKAQNKKRKSKTEKKISIKKRNTKKKIISEKINTEKFQIEGNRTSILPFCCSVHKQKPKSPFDVLATKKKGQINKTTKHNQPPKEMFTFIM